MIRVSRTLQPVLWSGLFIGLLATSAWANQEQYYVGIKGGIGGGPDAKSVLGRLSATVDTDLGPVVMGTVGHALGNGMRLEGEISWRRNNLDSASLRLPTASGSVDTEGNLQNRAVMVNGVYDFQFGSSITPFVLGGIGVSRVDVEVTQIGSRSLNFEDDEIVFAYQVGAGLTYQLTESISLDVSYRFFGTPQVDSGGTEINNLHHNGLVGLSYQF